MVWIFAAAISGLTFAAVAVWVRRRFDFEGLLAASAIGCLLLGALIAVAGWSEQELLPPRFGALVVGTIAAAFTVNRLEENTTRPDPAFETVAGGAAFGGGAFVGFYLGRLFSLQGLPWIG